MSAYRQKAEQFVARLNADAEDTLPGEVRIAFGIAEGFAAKFAQIKADNRFSSQGHSSEIKKALAAGPLDHLKQIHRGVDRRLGNLRSELASFQPKLPDRSDTFGELQRRELREFLRNQKEGERRRLALEDPAFREAVAHAPAALSGLSQSTKDEVVAAIVEATHGARAEFNRRGISMLEEARTALSEAIADIRRQSGLSEREFSDVGVIDWRAEGPANV